MSRHTYHTPHQFVKWFRNFFFAADSTSALLVLRELINLGDFNASSDPRQKRTLGMVMTMIRQTWREKRRSRHRWWWRTQWGDPWCLQWDWAGRPSWSSCPCQCCQRSPCQSRSAPVEVWRMVAALLSFKIMNETCKVETYQSLSNTLLRWIWIAAHCFSWTFHTQKLVFWVSSNPFLLRLLQLRLHPPPCLVSIFHWPLGHQHTFLHNWHCSWKWTWSVFRCSLFLLDCIFFLPEKN